MFWLKKINFRLKISYDGTNYFGWQTQPNVRTIQNSIENSIKKIFSNQNIKLIGSGRTDSGVHANGQIANIEIETEMLPKQLTKAINSYLSKDIYIEKCDLVDDDFHSRFSAKKRQYFYYISNSYSPINRMYLWNCKWNLDLSKLHTCASLIIGKHDFSLLSKASSDTKNKICKVYQSEWEIEGSKIIYKITANRFLQHMVRLIIGSMVEVARGRMTINDFKNILNNSNAFFSSVRAPSHGLYLNEIFYD